MNQKITAIRKYTLVHPDRIPPTSNFIVMINIYSIYNYININLKTPVNHNATLLLVISLLHPVTSNATSGHIQRAEKVRLSKEKQCE